MLYEAVASLSVIAKGVFTAKFMKPQTIESQ